MVDIKEDEGSSKWDQLPEVKEKFELLKSIKKDLCEATINKFNDSFEKYRDVQSLIQSIQVFFNLEILNEQIQNKVN